LKLLLLGKTQSEGGDDPWPVVLPGEDKPLPSNKIGDYVNGEFFHYYQFYINTKHAGPPFAGGWTEWPAWVAQLLTYFDNAIDVVRAHNERLAYEGIRAKYG
jgi:hypothetical protein